jgi:hypothetical protein
MFSPKVGARFAAAVPVAALLLAGGLAHGGDPTTADCLAASAASLDADNEHRLRDERAQLRVCAAASCPTEIRAECVRRAAEVSAQIPTIAFSALDASGGDVRAVRVIMDGETLAEQLEGQPFSIDPGEHTFTFEAAGRAPVTKQFVVVEGQKDRREVIVFGAALPSSPGSAPAGERRSPAAPPDVARRQTMPGLDTQRAVALLAAGVGVVGVGLGAVFGIAAMGKRNDAESACPAACATQAGVNRWRDAAGFGNASTIAFLLGGAGLAGGAVLWLTAPRAGDVSSAQVGVAPGALVARGTW